MTSLRFRPAGVCALLACALLATNASAQAGIDSGRATDDDVARLISDLNHVAMAETRIRLGLTRQLLIDRQKQLLGLESETSTADLKERTKAWWRENILDVLTDIATNPAAPCDVAKALLTRLLALARQSSLLGLPDDEFSIGSDFFQQSFKLVRRRCLEEAFDECMTTGNGAALVNLLVHGERQAQLGGFDDAEFPARVAYLFRRCTVYKVKFHSESRSQTYFEYKSVVEGSRTLLFQPGPAADVVDQFRNGEWRGPLPAEVDAPDVMLIEQSCRSLQPQMMRVTCGPALRPHPKQAAYQHARAMLTLKRNFSDLTFDSRGALQIVKREDGENKAWLIFLPLGLQGEVKYVIIPTGKESPPQPFSTLDGFVATFVPGQKITDFERQGYPALFTKEVVAPKNFGGAAFSGKVRYEIIHRPDLYPPDQIDPKYELGPERQKPTAPRKPARKKA